MADNTKISWCDATWSPITGCSPCSAGCRFCYASTMAKRFWGNRKFSDIQFHPDRLDQPFKWKKPKRIFVCSMSDLFHEDVEPWQQYRIFKTAYDLRNRHIFMFLTKRPENMLRFITNQNVSGYCSAMPFIDNGKLPDSFHIGITAENQEQADKRIPILLQIPAVVRFISVEPMLSKIDLSHLPESGAELDLVICGTESGPKRRSAKIEWIRDLKDQCVAAGVPFFLKQIEINSKVSHQMDEWPEDLMKREFPAHGLHDLG